MFGTCRDAGIGTANGASKIPGDRSGNLHLTVQVIVHVMVQCAKVQVII